MKKIPKLTLRKIDVEQSDILSKRQLKYILGGYGGDEYDSLPCNGGSNWECTCLSGPKKDQGFCTCDSATGASESAASYCGENASYTCDSKSY